MLKILVTCQVNCVIDFSFRVEFFVNTIFDLLSGAFAASFVYAYHGDLKNLLERLILLMDSP